MQRIHLYPPTSTFTLILYIPAFFLPQSFPICLKYLYTFLFLLLLRKHWAILFFFFNLSLLDYFWIIDNVCPNSRTNIHSWCHPHAEGDVPRPGSRHTRLSRIRCGAECAKQSTTDRGEMAKTPWPQIGGSLPAPSCGTPIKRQHFCASRAGRSKPLKPDNSQIPGTVFMASVG